METEWVRRTVEFYVEHAPVIAFVVGTTSILGVYVSGIAFLSQWRGYMIRKARREYVQVFLTDLFVSDIEDAIIEGVLTREEAIEMYRDLKKCFPIPNLFPATERLKEDISKRLASGMHAVVELPEVKKKPKNMLEA